MPPATFEVSATICGRVFVHFQLYVTWCHDHASDLLTPKIYRVITVLTPSVQSLTFLWLSAHHDLVIW